jgi:tetratricopeptide (TPR) repeat protein
LGAELRWDEALGAAKEWRRRDSSETLDPDLAIAGAELHLGDATAANQQIEPYFDRAMQDPDKFTAVILLHARALLANHQPEQVENLIGPLLSKSERFRRLWTSLAVYSLDDPQRARAWLERVAVVTPENPTEKLKLADAWISVGRRWTNSDDQQRGVSLVRALAQAQDPSTQAILTWGTTCEASADWAGAQDAYRRVLQKEPANPIALNNLASVLVTSGGDLQEAQGLVENALALYPKTPNFLDTKAMVQSARKDFNGAIASLKEAQRLDPQNFKWPVNILADLIASGQTQAAKSEVQQITAALPTFAHVTPDVQQRYDLLCAKLQ